MNVPITWDKTASCEYATRNRIIFGRVWKTPDGKFQIAIDLPLGDARPKESKFKDLGIAKSVVKNAIQLWFDQVDA